ncbi:MAG: hypothetical protein JWO56_2079 [Acidobacteria bacterium]|nr:hypothetical protein [Acidobacteriota bacterium]
MIDLLYAAFHRLAFTRESFTALLANTDWELVRELVVYDDGSIDGTREWLRAAIRDVPVPARLVESSFGSPVALMADFLERATAPIAGKIDNDAVVPPHWLRDSLAVLDTHPELDFLGLEAIAPPALLHDGPRSYRPAVVISGLGLYRRAAFAESRPNAVYRWFGFEEWQVEQEPPLTAGWIDPAPPLFLLDRLPFEPWRSLTDAYVASGWQRPWQRYDESEASLWSWRWPEPVQREAAPPSHIVILSANGENLVACIESILRNEPRLDRSRIIVVDDGARELAGPRLPGIRWVSGAKPFVFARNANIGIAAAGTDVILLNDDAQLVTPDGFTKLATLAGTRPDVGILSAAIDGVVGNPDQLVQPEGTLRIETAERLCFVCVYLPRTVLAQTGGLEESFTGYGYEDTDYSLRVLMEGLQLAVYDGCVVDHSGVLPSTFRTRPDFVELDERNERLYRERLEQRTSADGESVLAVLRVRNEARFIAEVLESVLPLCGRVLVFDDHSDDDTVAICRSFGERITVLHSPFCGLDEARDKNYMLQRVLALDPAWVLWIDGDEVLERSGPARLREVIEADDEETTSYRLKVAYVWDGSGQVRVDGIFGTMCRTSFFCLRGQPLRALGFPMVQPPNFHCGNVPHGLRGEVADLDVRLKHLGYVTPAQRSRKYDWYSRLDPGNAGEDLYRHLAGVPGARWAPGPPVLVPWEET